MKNIPFKIIWYTLVAHMVCPAIALGEDVSRPNVLMIAIDDLNDYVSILQKHPGIETPNFDRLAKRSVNFTRAYCAAPICNPSRVAIDTGLAPHQSGIYELGQRMSRSKVASAAITLPEQFQRHGYKTYMSGKYYHNSEDHWWPMERLDAMWTERKLPFSDHSPKDGPNKIIGGGILSIGPTSLLDEEMPDAKVANNTREWLAQDHDAPFLIVNGINKPHLSFVVPQRFFDLYPLASIAPPEAPVDDWGDIPPTVKSNFLRSKDVKQAAKISRTENGWKEIMQAYLASISYCDWVLGRILDDLDSSQYADNTIVMLWSDHGYHIGEKQWIHKRALWTQTTRVPFLISVPGMATAGQSCAAPVNLLDILPTLNELCQFQTLVPQSLAGHSLVPLLNDPHARWPHVSVTSHGVGNAAVTGDRYRLIHYADGSEELYDLETDPREYANLAQHAEFAPAIESLSGSVPQSWATIGDRSETKDRADESLSMIEDSEASPNRLFVTEPNPVP